MSVINSTCPICTEVFKNAEDIYSTSCGHIFHFACMNDWRTRSTSCPQCRHYNPTTHKLYLSFEDTNENPIEIDEIKTKLKSANEKIEQLRDQLDETEFNFLQMQEQYTNSEKFKKKLEDEMVQSLAGEENFLKLQNQYTESSEAVKELESQIHLLTIENELKARELNLKCNEIESLTAALDAVEDRPESFNKIKILEKKLKLITAEFDNEIKTSTQLSIENMKLQSFVDRIKLGANKTKSEKNIEARSNSLHSGSMKSLVDHEPKKKNDRPVSGNVSDSDINKVIIKNFPINKITSSLKDVIINIASKMFLVISTEDLCKVNRSKPDKNGESPKVILFVQFRTLDLKHKFLSNVKLLENYPEYNFLKICSCIDDQCYEVYVYAQQKLKAIGFDYIDFKNNQITARKQQHHRRVIKILNKSQVDDLVIKNSVSASAAFKPSNNIDENYYQL